MSSPVSEVRAEPITLALANWKTYNLHRNPCGCWFSLGRTLCQQMNPYNCCGKCSEAIEMEKERQQRDKTKLYAILVRCSCRLEPDEPLQPVEQVKPIQTVQTVQTVEQVKPIQTVQTVEQVISP